MTTEDIKLKAVGLFSFNATTREYEKHATARIQPDGTVGIDGNPVLVGRLRDKAVMVDGRAFVTDDGHDFLMALIKRFSSPYLKAMPLKA